MCSQKGRIWIENNIQSLVEERGDGNEKIKEDFE
jgi:hypothetical protein